VSTAAAPRSPRLRAVARENATVTPLELFFDLVFVLALTQCTALMADEPTWSGVGKGLVILGMLWWSWVGYSWLTSVIDPEEGAVRLAIFAAMAALLVVAECVPEAFGDLGLLFAGGYAVVRIAHIALFMAASRDDPGLRTSSSGSRSARRSPPRCWWAPRSRTAGCRAGSGCSRWCWTWPGRC